MQAAPLQPAASAMSARRWRCQRCRCGAVSAQRGGAALAGGGRGVRFSRISTECCVRGTLRTSARRCDRGASAAADGSRAAGVANLTLPRKNFHFLYD